MAEAILNERKSIKIIDAATGPTDGIIFTTGPFESARLLFQTGGFTTTVLYYYIWDDVANAWFYFGQNSLNNANQIVTLSNVGRGVRVRVSVNSVTGSGSSTVYARGIDEY